MINLFKSYREAAIQRKVNAEVEFRRRVAAQEVQGKQEDEKKKSKADHNNAINVFTEIKKSTVELSEALLNQYKREAQSHIETFEKAGQELAKAKTEWLITVAEKEAELLKLGATRCCSRESVRKFMEKHPTRALMIANLEDYERCIPGDALKVVEATKHLFDQFLVVYTDHTKKAARTVQKVRDPILFGTFVGSVRVGKCAEDTDTSDASKGYISLHSKESYVNVMADRLYFLADWEDEFCDLTWDKMLSEAATHGVKLVPESLTDHKPLQGRINQLDT